MRKFNLWCSVSGTCHIIWHPTRSLSFFSFLSLSLSVVLWQISFEQCHMLEGLLSDNLSDNLAKTIYCRPSHRAISITLERTWKDMSAKMRGKCLQMEGRWKEVNAHWNENERTWIIINERNMKGKWKEMNAKWEEHACKWKEHEGRCMQINAKLKEHEVLPKHLKLTKQLLDPFPSLFRNGFWLHVGSRTCWFPQNPGKR